MNCKKTGELITRVRKEHGLTQKELAQRLHISDRTISKWERGVGFPDVSLLEPLADALDLTISEIVIGEKSSSETRIMSDDEVLKEAYAIIKSNVSKQICKKVVATSLSVIFPFFISIFFWSYIPNELAILVGTSSPYTSKLFAFTVAPLVLLLVNAVFVFTFEGKIHHSNLNVYSKGFSFPLLVAPTGTMIGKLYCLFRHAINWIIPAFSWLIAGTTYIEAFIG